MNKILSTISALLLMTSVSFAAIFDTPVVNNIPQPVSSGSVLGHTGFDPTPDTEKVCTIISVNEYLDNLGIYGSGIHGMNIVRGKAFEDWKADKDIVEWMKKYNIKISDEFVGMVYFDTDVAKGSEDPSVMFQMNIYLLTKEDILDKDGKVLKTLICTGEWEASMELLVLQAGLDHNDNPNPDLPPNTAEKPPVDQPKDKSTDTPVYQDLID